MPVLVPGFLSLYFLLHVVACSPVLPIQLVVVLGYHSKADGTMVPMDRGVAASTQATLIIAPGLASLN